MKTNTSPTISEAELIYLLKIKDVNALAHLYDAYAKALYNIIFQIIGDEDEAEKILQFTFFHCWNSFYLFDANNGFLFSWLSIIARNTALQHKKERTKELSLQPIITLTKSTNKKLIDQLSSQHRQLIELFFYSGFSLLSIAEKLNTDYQIVQTDFRAAILALRNLK